MRNSRAKTVLPVLATLGVLAACMFALYRQFGPRTQPGQVAARAVDCLWAGDFACIEPYVRPKSWQTHIPRDVMDRVFREYFKPKLARYKIIEDKDRVQVNFPNQGGGGTGMFVLRPDGTEARLQLDADMEDGVPTIGISRPFRSVWTMEYAPKHFGRRNVMAIYESDVAMLKSIVQDKKRLVQMGLNGMYTRWGTFVSWNVLEDYFRKNIQFQRWGFSKDRDKLPKPEYPYLPGDPQRAIEERERLGP